MATHGPGAIAPDELRLLMRRNAATVTVVTVAGEARPAGFTATSFTSVSLRPPLVSFCVARASSCWRAVAAAEHVAVHLLGAGQAELARRFATTGIDRFAGPARWRPGPYGVPLLDGVLAWLVCRVADRVPAGDHVIVLAEPVSARHGEGEPLLYHNGQYARLCPSNGRPVRLTGAIPLARRPDGRDDGAAARP